MGLILVLLTVFSWFQVSGVGLDVARMWEMALQHALMPAVSTGVSHSSHRSGHGKILKVITFHLNIV